MSLLEKLKKSSTIKETSILAKSEFFTEKDMIRTEVPMINVALSGSLDGGLTPGLTMFAGPSKHFKTAFALLMASAYMKKYEDAVVLFYDSEFGTPQKYFETFNIDTDRVLHTPITDVEELKHDIMNQLQSITKGDRVIIILDSIGNLASKKEMDNEWWENALSAEGAANFWGENILKNAGFMVGAMSASKLAGAGLSRLVKLEAARTEFKTIQNAATKLGLGEDIAAKNMDEIMNIARNNPAMYGAASESVIKDLGNAAQKVRAKTFQVQAGAATLGAFGEARMEAIGNGNQYRESLLMPLNQKYKQGLITEDEYNEELKKIDKQVEAYQNVSWLSNALLLTGSNYLGWRDSFLKPYDYNAKNIIGKAEGSIAKGYNYVAPPIFTTALKRKAVDAFRESQEEQAQFFIDKATGSYINALYNGNDYAQSLGKALSEGFSETYGSAEGSATIEAPDASWELENTDGTALGGNNIPSGDNYLIIAPDGTAHIKHSQGGTIANVLVPSGATELYTVADSDIEINGNYEFSIHATHTFDIRLKDQSNNTITPTSITCQAH